jgi:hypothetical protein
MDTKDAGRMGGAAKAANMTPEQKTDMGRKMAAARWGSIARAKRSASRKAGRMAKESRKRNARVA